MGVNDSVESLRALREASNVKVQQRIAHLKKRGPFWVAVFGRKGGDVEGSQR